MANDTNDGLVILTKAQVAKIRDWVIDKMQTQAQIINENKSVMEHLGRVLKAEAEMDALRELAKALDSFITFDQIEKSKKQTK